MCRGSGGASPERVRRLYGCGGGSPRSREDAGRRVGLTALPDTANWRGLVPLRQRGKGSFRFSVAPAPWSAAFLRYIRQPRGYATRQGKCLTTTRFRGLSAAAHPTKRRAATLSLNVSAQNILKKLCVGYLRRWMKMQRAAPRVRIRRMRKPVAEGGSYRRVVAECSAERSAEVRR